MAFLKLALLFFCAAVALADQHCHAPGTTITTITTTTVSGEGGVSEGSDSGVLSSQERNLIRSSWKKAKRDGDVAPKILFRFLQAHPEYQKKFSLFANIPKSELMTNGNFLGQAYTIMAGLNEVIEALGSKDNLAKEINHLGWTHFNRGVSVAMFEQFSRIIIEVLEEEMGSRFDRDVKDAWEDGLKALVNGISKNLKKEEDIAHPQTGLTTHQITDIRRTWENYRNDRNAIVSLIFIKLFKEFPSAQQKFRSFADVSIDSLSGNAAFNAQVKLVADRLDNMIATMDNTLQIMGQIQYMGHSHKPRAVERSLFEAFARYLIDILGSKGVASDDLDSWRGALKVMVNAISNVQV